MQNERDAGEVVVTQEDRKAFQELRGIWGPIKQAMLDNGEFDATWEMQLLARHRLSTRPPAPEDAGTVERALQGLADIFEHFKDRKQAPDHGHAVPGIWDNYNGDKSGKPCDWCAKWNAARSALAALSRLDGEAG